ncbi:unnamed protein product [Danaus chrysippus]|uniref:protein-disulfide reductase n=1 Tax=Danaus chrysippus TaxID=151541 RepID=A0A8J2W4U3_9NEOP|nr:unnamed protein product [Danaus chrysippus]
MESTEFKFKPYEWLKDVEIFNKNNELVPHEWLQTNADVICLLFSSYETDKDGVIEKFYSIYENVKHVNLPIEVINVPMDETEEDMMKCYEEQANWFTVKHSDPVIPVLKYMYEVTSVPHLIVIQLDGSIVSRHGILDLEEYGKNAVITWTSKTSTVTKHRNLSKELMMYGKDWVYMKVDQKFGKTDYQKRFSTLLAEDKR